VWPCRQQQFLLGSCAYSRAAHQTVSRRLLIAAVRVRAQFRSCAIYGRQSGTGANFLRIFRFPLPPILPTAPHSSSSIMRGWHNRPNSGRRTKWTQSDPTPRNLRHILRLAGFGDSEKLRKAGSWQTALTKGAEG
jgi:hypothetical protein